MDLPESPSGTILVCGKGWGFQFRTLLPDLWCRILFASKESPIFRFPLLQREKRREANPHTYTYENAFFNFLGVYALGPGGWLSGRPRSVVELFFGLGVPSDFATRLTTTGAIIRFEEAQAICSKRKNIKEISYGEFFMLISSSENVE